MIPDHPPGNSHRESGIPLTEQETTSVVCGTVFPVTPLTIAAFLIGRRQAILDIAHCPQSLTLGAFFVLSAGLAREYDGEDLLHEPWHVLIPFAASLMTSFVLYSLLRIFAARRTKNLPSFARGYPDFLALYWMTAPLAWMYAIPFERWLTPGDATLWNLRLLGIISSWRVTLIIRVVYVAWGARPLASIIVLVLLFGDAVMLAFLRFVPVPLLQFMGGVRLTESESILQSTTILLQIAGYPSLLLLLLALFPVFAGSKPWESNHVPSAGRIHKSLWIVVSCVFLAIGAVLPFTQPEQQLRHQVERDLTSGHIHQALERMSHHVRIDFPPHWNPPPHVALRNATPPLTKVLDVIVAEPPAAWVRETFLQKLRSELPAVLSRYHKISDEELSAYLVLLDRLPLEEWYFPAHDVPSDFDSALRQIADEDRKLTEESRKSLQRILARLPSETTLEEQPAE